MIWGEVNIFEVGAKPWGPECSQNNGPQDALALSLASVNMLHMGKWEHVTWKENMRCD